MILPLNLSLLLRNGSILAVPHADPCDRDLHELLWINHLSLVVMMALSRMSWRERWEEEDTATNAALLA